MKHPTMRKAADGQSCVRCGANDGTTVFAHYSGGYSLRLGNGMGTKSDDLLGADLCHQCHTRFDSYAGGNTPERDSEFMFCIFQTLLRRREQGIIRVCDARF